MNDTAANPVSTRQAPTCLFPGTAIASAVGGRVVGWLGVAGAFAFSMAWGIQSFGIQDNNEGLYAEVAREMNAGGDWVVPHLNGAPYLDKPPLLYWVEAVLMRLFGGHEWAVRLGPVLWFAGTVAAVVWIGRLVRGSALGRNAALLLCSALGVVGMSRSLLFDGPLTCALTWALACFLRYRITGERRSLRWCYAILGAGVMAKGLIAVVIGGGTMLIATFGARSSWRDVVRLADRWGLAAFAAVVVPWHVLAAMREPGFVDFYFINEHVRRFLGTRLPHDFYTGPAYYYVVRLPLYLGVWLFALPLLGAGAGGRTGDVPLAEREARRLFSTACGLTLGFFSLSEGKANYYLLCIMPALAVLLALAWPRDGIRRKRLWVCAGGVTAVALLLAAAPLLFAHRRHVMMLIEGHRLVLGAAAVALLGIAAVMTVLIRRRRNQAVFWCTAAAGLVLLLPLPVVLRQADGAVSQRSLARFMAEHPEPPVFLYREYEALSSFVYYAGRPVPIVDSESNELYYARQHYAAAPAFVGGAAVAELARRQPVWLVTTPRCAPAALAQFAGESPHVVRAYPRAVVIAIGAEHAPRVALAGRRAQPDARPGAP